ncbi:MAG: hypothetical protein ABI480_10710 [Chitinophagaceae bacterium]
MDTLADNHSTESLVPEMVAAEDIKKSQQKTREQKKEGAEKYRQ